MKHLRKMKDVVVKRRKLNVWEPVIHVLRGAVEKESSGQWIVLTTDYTEYTE